MKDTVLTLQTKLALMSVSEKTDKIVSKLKNFCEGAHLEIHLKLPSFGTENFLAMEINVSTEMLPASTLARINIIY